MLSYGLDLKLNLDLIRNAHIKCVNFENRWLCLISISSGKFEFDEYKMYLDVEIVAPSMLQYNSKFNHFSEYYVRCHFVIPP